ncbi:bud site selection protein 16 [Paxillus ammoniavirescens]|nr:bud site selection protein 16 [Paxillus ammoniavirescens]
MPIQGQPPHTNGTFLTATTCSERILSIQSHVSFGYVGGKAAVFPLQCMGYDVDVVNTVNFSNHSGYGDFGGTRTTAEELTRLFNLMQQSGVLIPGRLLTGYIPNAESLSAVHELVKKLKITNADLLYLLDPVIGDSGKVYVAENCVPLYRRMLPLATIITPNWFEVEVLTDIPLIDLPSLRAALHKLHKIYQVPNVVISSIPLTKLSSSLPSYLLPRSPAQPSPGTHSTNGTNKPVDEEPPYLLCMASSLNAHDDLGGGSLSTVYASCVPLIPGYFSGVGDLFSALLLGHFSPAQSVVSSPSPALAHATSHALSKTHAILTLTHESASTLNLTSTDDELDAREPGRKNRRMKGRELRMIQGQEVFRRKDWDGVERMTIWEGFWKD